MQRVNGLLENVIIFSNKTGGLRFPCQLGSDYPSPFVPRGLLGGPLEIA